MKTTKKMQKGGSTGKTKKYKTKNSYDELTGTTGNPLRTTVSSPGGNYKKNIEWQSYLADGNKPYEMSVTKGGKTNKFQLSKEQALSQRKKVKKTMGFQNGGTVKPVVKKVVPKKPVPKKVVPASSSDMKTFRLMQGYDTKGNKVEKMQKGGFPITEKAAARKVAKGKGMMTYKYGTTDAPGTGNNKGAYVKFTKDKESNPYGGKSLKGSRSRSVMQKGGVKK